MQIRVGIGQDSHPFVESGNKKPLTLGGITISEEMGLIGNSDGDVILHSLFNALSQAVGERSLGIYSDPLCLEKGITDSKEYLKIALKMIEERGYVINNIGIMIEAKVPKIEPHTKKMKECIAKLLKINEDQIGITATSGNGLTAFGKGEGIQVITIVSLIKP